MLNLNSMMAANKTLQRDLQQSPQPPTHSLSIAISDAVSFDPERAGGSASIPLSPSISAPLTGSSEVLFCCICNKRISSHGAFRRHVAERHVPQFRWCCPGQGCGYSALRKDQIMEHFRRHHLRNPTVHEIDRAQREMPCPFVCEFCSATFTSWLEYFRCFKSHCRNVSASSIDSRPE